MFWFPPTLLSSAIPSFPPSCYICERVYRDREEQGTATSAHFLLRRSAVRDRQPSRNQEPASDPHPRPSDDQEPSAREVLFRVKSLPTPSSPRRIRRISSLQYLIEGLHGDLEASGTFAQQATPHLLSSNRLLLLLCPTNDRETAQTFSKCHQPHLSSTSDTCDTDSHEQHHYN